MSAYHVVYWTIVDLGKTPINASYQCSWQSLYHLPQKLGLV